MSSVEILLGLPGSGKSTYAKAVSSLYNMPVVSKDDIRTKLHAGVYSLKNEKEVIEYQKELLQSYAESDKHVILDNAGSLSRPTSLIKELDIFDQIRATLFVCDVSCARLNDLRRQENRVGVDVIRKFEFSYVSTRMFLETEYAGTAVPEVSVYNFFGNELTDTTVRNYIIKDYDY